MIELKPGLEIRRFGSDAILLDLETGDYFALNPTALSMAEGLLAGQSEQVIAEAIAAKYALKSERAQEDLQAFQASLVDEGLAVKRM